MSRSTSGETSLQEYSASKRADPITTALALMRDENYCVEREIETPKYPNQREFKSSVDVNSDFYVKGNILIRKKKIGNIEGNGCTSFLSNIEKVSSNVLGIVGDREKSIERDMDSVIHFKIISNGLLLNGYLPIVSVEHDSEEPNVIDLQFATHVLDSGANWISISTTVDNKRINLGLYRVENGESLCWWENIDEVPSERIPVNTADELLSAFGVKLEKNISMEKIIQWLFKQTDCPFYSVVGANAN